MAVTGDSIRQFVGGKTVAVAGASATGKGFGSFAYSELKKRGYRVMAVHPTASAVHGDPCWPSFANLPEPNRPLPFAPPRSLAWTSSTASAS